MVPHGRGAILFTGASASMKGYAHRRRSRWASSRCAGSPRAWRASSRRRASTSRISSSTAASASPAAASRPTSPTRMLDPGCDRRQLSACPPPAAQRLDLGGRAAALGREVLSLLGFSRSALCASASDWRSSNSRGKDEGFAAHASDALGLPVHPWSDPSDTGIGRELPEGRQLRRLARRACKRGRRQGVSQRAIDAALARRPFRPAIVKKDRGQGVFAQTFLEFSDRMVARLPAASRAPANIKKYKSTFARIEKQFGVPAPVHRRLLGAGDRFRRQYRQRPDADLAGDARL